MRRPALPRTSREARVREGRGRVRLGLLVLVVVVVLGTLWFWLVEHFNFLDAAFQVTMTVTTVGFGEVHPFGPTAKVVAIFLMIVGVGAALYTLGGVFEELFESQIDRFGRRRMQRRIDDMHGHVVLCGWGRVGRMIADLLDEHLELVVVESSEGTADVALAAGIPVVVGDATEDAVLEQAGIERAAVLVVSLESDSDAISTVLSARVLNPALRIVARANSGSSEPKLVRAGVDHVVNPLHMGAQRLASFAQQPAVADFLDVVAHDGALEHRFEEYLIPPTSAFAGRALGETAIGGTGVLVLAIREANGRFVSNPGPDARLEPGAKLIVMGAPDQIDRLDALKGGEPGAGRSAEAVEGLPE